MSCPSVRLNSEDTWPTPPGGDDLVQPRFPRVRFPRGPGPDADNPPPKTYPDPYKRPEWDEVDDPVYEPPDPRIPPDLVPPEPPGDPPDFPGVDPLDEPVVDLPDPDEPGLETPEGIDLEQFEEGFEDSDDFFHEDYETPDEDENRLTPQRQEQEAGQNARLMNLWFKGIGRDLIQGQLPGLTVNTVILQQARLKRMLDERLLTEYAKAESYYANLFSMEFLQRSTGGKEGELQSYTPRVREQGTHGGFSDGDLRTAAGVAVTGVGILASYGFLRYGRGFHARGAVSTLMDLTAP